MEVLYAAASVSITELKRNPRAVISKAEGEPVAVLVHNKPEAYIVPAASFETLIDRLEDMELAQLVEERRREKPIKVKLDGL